MTLHPDVEDYLERVRASKRPAYQEMGVDEARKNYLIVRANAAPELQPLDVMRDYAADGPHGPIPVRHYRPKGSGDKALPALVYYHGGGWVLGDLTSLDTTCAHLANKAGCAVISVDYRLAPEHKFPKAVDDAMAAVKWTVAQAKTLGVDATRVAVGGDSAGGNLAAAVCLIARDEGGLKISYQLLIYPALDFIMDTPSHRRFGDGYLLTHEAMLWFRDLYLRGPEDYRDQRASPLRAASLANMPPAFVLTAGYDPLRDEGEAYAKRLAEEAAVPVTLWRLPQQIHGFLPMGKLFRDSAPTLDKLAGALKLALA